MTNEKIKQLMIEIIGVDTLPPIVSEGVEVFNDTIMETLAERIVAECIAAVDTGDVNVDNQVTDQINTWFGITAP
jgi:hypothetical protein